MPRLRTPPKRLAALQSRIAPPVGSSGAAASVSEAGARRSLNWLKTWRWQVLRKKIIQRDGAVCQATGVLLVGRHPEPNSPVVDHIKPHRGDPDLFWDESNLQTVSKAYHDRTKQSLEKRGVE